jgi:hypothetical protein
MLALAALLVSGCGSGGSSSATTSSSTAALTKQQYLKEGTAICVKAEAERGAALKASPLNPFTHKLSKAQEKKLVLQSALPPIRKMTREIAALPAPDGEEQEVEDIVKAMESALRKSESEPLAALSGASFVASDEAVKAYGLVACNI